VEFEAIVLDIDIAVHGVAAIWHAFVEGGLSDGISLVAKRVSFESELRQLTTSSEAYDILLGGYLVKVGLT
jgi:hypothetical protein